MRKFMGAVWFHYWAPALLSVANEANIVKRS